MKKRIALGALAALIALVLLFAFLPGLAWTLVILVLLLMAVVLFVPIGADVAFVDGKFSLAARVNGFALQLIPRKPREEKKPEEEKPKEEKKPEEPKQETAAKPRPKLNLTKEEIFELIKKAIQSLGKFGKMTVRKFMLHYTAAGWDPYDAAMNYGYVNSALSTLAPICARTFNVKGDVDVRTDVDYLADWMHLDIALSMTIRLIQIVRVGLALAVGVLGILIRHWRRERKEARLAKKNGVPAENAEDQSNNNDTEIKQDEERNDLNGKESDRRADAEHDGECEEHSQG